MRIWGVRNYITFGTLPERVQQLVNIHILGNVGNLATGSTDVTQITRQEVFQGDLESLKRYLSGIGIDVGLEDLDELENALELDKKEGVTETLGGRTKGWIKRISEKASTGIGAAGVSVASDLISKAIEMYLGLPI